MCTHNIVLCIFLTFFSIFRVFCATFAAVNKRILALALPSIASNITVPLLGLCDVTIMGHIGGATSIAAIAVGSMIFNVMYWLFGFLRMGTSGLTAQAYGNSKPSTLNILRSSLTAALGLGLAIVVLQVPLRWLSFWLMQVPADVSGLCTHYYYMCVWGAPAMLGLYSLTGWFIGMQDTRTPMMIAIGQNVLNISLSLFLVAVLHMGIAGVALGTMVSQWAAFIVAMVAVRRIAPAFKWFCKAGSSRLTSLSLKSSKVYADIFLRTLCLVAVNLYFTSAGATQGALTLAANTLLMQFFMFFSYVMDGFAFAGEALAGKSYGAGDEASLRRVVVSLFRWGVGVALLFTVVYALCGRPLLAVLTSDAAVVSAAIVYLPWAVLIPAVGMAAFVWDGIFIGITATRAMFWTCLAASVAFFAFYLLLRTTMANHALWLAMLIYLSLRGLLQTAYWRSRSRANSMMVSRPRAKSSSVSAT